MEILDIIFEVAMVVASLMPVLVTFMLWRSSSEMARATRELSEIAESNRQLQHQPRLVIAQVQRDSESSLFRIFVKNVGNGIALSVNVQVGDSNWHAYDRVFASRVSPNRKALEAGQEDEWTIQEHEAILTEGKLWVGVLYEGAILPPGAANFGTWGSVSTYSDTFVVGNSATQEAQS